MPIDMEIDYVVLMDRIRRLVSENQVIDITISVNKIAGKLDLITNIRERIIPQRLT